MIKIIHKKISNLSYLTCAIFTNHKLNNYIIFYFYIKINIILQNTNKNLFILPITPNKFENLPNLGQNLTKIQFLYKE